MNYFGDVFANVMLMESFLMETLFRHKCLGDVFTGVVLMESFASPAAALRDHNGQGSATLLVSRPPRPQKEWMTF